jgi:Tol biopolymer transport system component/tRNA A-37 threonylcarbamoyl transferase component Bud32
VTQQSDRLNTALAGRYRIERELGAGGMATVFLAEDLKHKRKVALKVLKPELAAVLGAERFVVEITTTASLQHPHILALFDSGTADGFLFYVMPWIQGETLREKLNRETQLGVDEAVRIAREVLDALEYAHQHGIVHRDIKPENILLHGGHAMVADFGIALAVSAAAGGRMTETGLSLGTPHYMSPEQATAEKEITARSDVYSLGSVLYEMLTGNPPHTGASAQQIIMKIITEAAAPVTQLRKSVPLNVTAAVAKSLEKLAADRFESAKAFGEALGNPAYTNAAVTGAVPAAALARRKRVTTAAGFVLALAATAAVTRWIDARHSEAPLAVHFAFSTAPSQPLGITLGRTVALSPDGHIVVYATVDSAGHVRLFKRALDDLGQQPIAGTDAATFPFFSPDGRWLGFFDGRQLKKIPVEGGTATPLADLPGLFGASWGPAGIVASTNGKLVLVPSSGGTPVPLTRGDSTTGYWPVVLPDGKTVVYATTQTGTAQLAVAVLATGRVVDLGLSGRAPVGIAGGELIFERADAALMAIPFDVGARRVTGSARVVVADVAQNGPGETKAALSANGSLVYVSESGTVQAVVVDLHGAARPLAIPPGRLNNPRYAPDGRRIAADLESGGRRDVWIYDVASGAAHRVTAEGTLNDRPEWTPDGTRVLFRSDRAGRNTTLWWQPADGSGAAQELLAVPRKDVWEGVLTPDGRTVVYRTGTLGSADIWYRRLVGDTAAHGIATTPFTQYAPRISPDGRWVVYASDESGSFQVVVRPFPGPGAQVTVSVGGGDTPVWSRDGRRIFYPDGTKLLAASVATSPTFSVTARDVLFEGNRAVMNPGHAAFDVSPDGKSFLMLRPVVANSEEIVVIPNWKAELRAQGKSTARP